MRVAQSTGYLTLTGNGNIYIAASSTLTFNAWVGTDDSLLGVNGGVISKYLVPSGCGLLFDTGGTELVAGDYTLSNFKYVTFDQVQVINGLYLACAPYFSDANGINFGNLTASGPTTTASIYAPTAGNLVYGADTSQVFKIGGVTQLTINSSGVSISSTISGLTSGTLPVATSSGFGNSLLRESDDLVTVGVNSGNGTAGFTVVNSNVNGNANISATSSGSGGIGSSAFILINSSNDIAYMELGNSGAGSLGRIFYISASSGVPIQIQTFGSGGDLTLNSSGNLNLKAATGSVGITGAISGLTAGTIPMASATTGLANSMITQTGTAGITINSSSTAYLNIKDSQTALYVSSQGYLDIAAVNRITLSISSNTVLTVNSSGVGIGTTNPRQQLSVGSYLDLYSGNVNTPTVPSIRSTNGTNNLVVNAYSTGAHDISTTIQGVAVLYFAMAQVDNGVIGLLLVCKSGIVPPLIIC